MTSSRCQMKKVHMGIPPVTFPLSSLPFLSPSHQLMLHSRLSHVTSACLLNEKRVKRYTSNNMLHICIYSSRVFFRFYHLAVRLLFYDSIKKQIC